MSMYSNTDMRACLHARTICRAAGGSRLNNRPFLMALRMNLPRRTFLMALSLRMNLPRRTFLTALQSEGMLLVGREQSTLGNYGVPRRFFCWDD